MDVVRRQVVTPTLYDSELKGRETVQQAIGRQTAEDFFSMLHDVGRRTIDIPRAYLFVRVSDGEWRPQSDETSINSARECIQ